MMDYHQLREIEREEKDSNALTKVPKDFYARAKKLVEEVKAKVAADPAQYYREYEGVQKSLENIKRKRMEKIIFAAFLGQSPENITPEEEELFMKVVGAIADFEKALREEKPIVKEETPEGKVKVRIIKHVDAYIGADGKTTYGPFSPGDEVVIEKEEGEWLVDNGYAEYS